MSRANTGFKSHSLLLNGLIVVLLTGCGSTYKTTSGSSTTSADTTSAAGSTSTSTSTTTTTTSSALTAYAQNSTVQPGGTTYVYASGGTSPYTYSVVSGGGSIVATTGQYTAPTTDTSVTIQVIDATGQIAYAYVTIQATVTITASLSSVQEYGTLTLSASGGAAPYVFSVTSGDASISGTLFTAGSTPGTVTVMATDNVGRTATKNIAVTALGTLTVSPTSTTVDLYGTQALTVSGGHSPYTYRIVSGPGSMTKNYFVGTATTGTTRILVQDADGRTVSVTIVTQNVAMAADCQAYTVADGYGTRTASLVTIGGQQVCNMPVASTGTPDGTANCPSGWTALTSAGVPYTITQASYFNSDESDFFGTQSTTVYTGAHGSLAATPIESVRYCSSSDGFTGDCDKYATGYALVRNVACYE